MSWALQSAEECTLPSQRTLGDAVVKAAGAPAVGPESGGSERFPNSTGKASSSAAVWEKWGD